MDPAEPETTGRGSGGTGVAALFCAGRLSAVLCLEPPEPELLLFVDEPPVGLEPVCVGEVVVPVVLPEPVVDFFDELFPCFEAPPRLDCLALCFACPVPEGVVVGCVVACDDVVEPLCTAAAADCVVLDFDPLPPHPLAQTSTATVATTPRMTLAQVSRRACAPT